MSRRVVIGYYGFQTFFALYIWLPIFYAYQRQMGLDDAQIFGIQGYYYLAFVILEVPTGFFADRWGYRNTLQLGALLLFVSQLFAIFQPTYMGFLFHFLLLALARSLVSGAASAYLYEHLKLHGRQTDYKQLEGNARALGLIAKVIGWSGVGAMMAWHLSLPYWLTAGAALIALFVAISLPKLPTQATAQTDMPGWGAYRVTLASPVLMWLMVIGVGVFVIGRIVQVNLFQPLLINEGFDIATHGGIMAAMTIVEAVGSGRSRWLQKWFDDLGAMLVITIAVVLSMLLMGGLGKIPVIAGLLLFAWTTGLAFPIQKQLLNDAITDSRFRATILSIESIVDRAFIGIVAWMLGGFVATGRINTFLLISAVGVVLVTVLAFAVLRGYLKFRPSRTDSDGGK